VYKVETIGDCYVVAGGLVDELHAVRVMEFAKAMLRVSREVVLPTTGAPVQLRLGLHSGPAMSGVVGSKMPRFTVFGETVEAAHKMEASGVPGRIHVSGATRGLLKSEAWEATEGVQARREP
ncbi:guanylyl and adenylyl cyclase family member, partial [Volvox carteri f. nagariensis]